MTDVYPRRHFKRVVLKLGGEMFGGGEVGVDPDVVSTVAEQIAEVAADGVQVAVVIGGGNFFRGAQLHERGMDRARADYMGMLGTVMNCLALQDFLEREHHLDTRVQTAITMGQVAEPYIPRRAAAAPGKGPGGHLRRRGGHALLLHRHHRGAARAGDRRRGGADGQGRRRGLRRRPAGGAGRQDVHRDHPPRGPRAWPAGRRRDRVQPLHGQRHADHRVQPAGQRQHRQSCAGSQHRHTGVHAPREPTRSDLERRNE